ncbi:copper homeostasis protein CutC [Paenibacillus cymbidii]|uniref:copper homeostasis protein CutC n=1 Tax=Paenibacillus cymbidii TaxID=1639034 RepID=UPI001081C25A|nr:copper homeostasis protein CutC [Paenibacillus cymbidii]
MKLEVIATSVADAKLAERCGADRIELISGIREGGVTPSSGLIGRVLDAVAIPVHVMVRPHANSFCYDEDDWQTMLADIRAIRQCGAAGIVVGALTANRLVDEAGLRRVLEAADGLAVTFHRAFDETADQEEALRTLARYPQISRILTSGGKPSALEARETIKRLDSLCRAAGITLLAGSGLTVETLAGFIRDTGVAEVHMGTGVRRGHDGLAPIDSEKLSEAARIVAQFRRELAAKPDQA